MTEQDTLMNESGLALHDVIEQAANHGVDFEAMETGEVATFAATAREAGVGSQQVTIEKGSIYRYADYGLGTYLTEPYYISYGSVRATAYCIQPAKPGPGSALIPLQSWLITGSCKGMLLRYRCGRCRKLFCEQAQ